jgi:glycoprotein-N-acetylgalactosamine 3-beta-galactosyltransferase
MNNVIELGENKTSFAMLKKALTFIYIHHFDDYDWILKSDDSSFIVMENLRYLLYQYDSDFPLVIGQKFVNDFMPGVYAMSKQAYSRLIEKAFANDEICFEDSGSNDVDIAKCLKHVSVISIDALDREGRGMFFANNPQSALFPINDDNYDFQYFHKFKQGVDKCCSDNLIVVQGLSNTRIYYFEYFLYKVKTFGRKRKMRKLPGQISIEKIVENKV